MNWNLYLSVPKIFFPSWYPVLIGTHNLSSGCSVPGTQLSEFARYPAVYRGTQFLKFSRYPLPNGTQIFKISMGTGVPDAPTPGWYCYWFNNCFDRYIKYYIKNYKLNKFQSGIEKMLVW